MRGLSSDERRDLLSSRLLHLILMPTEQCNFRCVYCYEDFIEGQMPREVVDSVKALIQRRIGSLDLLSIEWFGGEPMLAWRIVEEVQAFACDLVASRGGRPALRGSMTTNGALLRRPRVLRLLELAVDRYQISLDGPASVHDRQRPRRGGGGSFDAIWRNLLDLRDLDARFEALLRIHLTPETYASVGELLEQMAPELAGDRRFPLSFKAVRRFGGPRDDELAVLEPDAEPELIDAIATRAEALGLCVERDAFADAAALQGCYASAVGSYVVRSNGDLAKCTVALAHPNNRVGRLLRDGTVDLDAERMQGWIRGALSGDRQTADCPMQGWADEPVERAPLVQLGGGRPAAEAR